MCIILCKKIGFYMDIKLEKLRTYCLEITTGIASVSQTFFNGGTPETFLHVSRNPKGKVLPRTGYEGPEGE
jgi:hypothetical protein